MLFDWLMIGQVISFNPGELGPSRRARLRRAFMDAAGIAGDTKGPLFRSSNKPRRRDTLKAMTRQTAIKMIKRRALEAGLPA